MALFLNMKEALSLELGRLYRAWDWEDLSFGEVRPSTLFAGIDAEVDFTYRGVTRTLAFKRNDPNKFFTAFPFDSKPVQISRDFEDKESIAEYLANRYGIPFEAADVADGAKLIAKQGWHALAISPKSPNYNVGLQYLSGEPAVVEEEYDLGWPLNGNGDCAVEGGPAITAQFDYVTVGGRQWASHATNRLQELGISLRAKGDFTLKFNVIATGTDVVDKIQGIFNDASGGILGQAVKISCQDVAGKWTIYNDNGTYLYNNRNALAFVSGKVTEITIRGVNGGYEYYIGKVLYARVNAVTDAFDAWTHIGQAGTFMSANILIGDIRYWEKAIDMPVLQAQSSAQTVRMMHYVEHDWLISAENTGRKDSTRVNPAQLYYAVDFTPQAHVLKTIPQKLAPYINGSVITDTPTLTKLRDAIQAVDPTLTWTITNTRTTNCLYGCWAFFNGKTVDFNDPAFPSDSALGYAHLPAESKWMQGKVADEAFDNVLCILLESANTQGGTLRVPFMLHYNDEV